MMRFLLVWANMMSLLFDAFSYFKLSSGWNNKKSSLPVEGNFIASLEHIVILNWNIFLSVSVFLRINLKKNLSLLCGSYACASSSFLKIGQILQTRFLCFYFFFLFLTFSNCNELETFKNKTPWGKWPISKAILCFC